MNDLLANIELPTVKVETTVPKESIIAVVVAFVLIISIALLLIKITK